MKFSIITVCKNSEKTIEKALLSVINQTCKDYEIIIIDGVSDDKTLEILANYRDKIAHLVSEPDEGLYDAMNKGILRASGEYLYFLNSDDILHDKNVLANTEKKLQDKDFDVVYGDICIKNSDTGEISLQKHDKFNKIYLLKNTPCQPGTFYNKNAFEKYGNFDKNYKIVSDHEWFLRVFLKNKPSCFYLGFPVNIFSTGGISTSPKREKMLIEERNKMLGEYFSPFERKNYEFLSKYLRSLTTFPIISDVINIIFNYKI